MVETIIHTDVRGKNVFYLKFYRNGKSVVVNVKQVDFARVKSLYDDPEEEAPRNEADKVEPVQDGSEVRGRGKR